MHQKLFSEARPVLVAEEKPRDLFGFVAIAWALGLTVLVLMMRAF